MSSFRCITTSIFFHRTTNGNYLPQHLHALPSVTVDFTIILPVNCDVCPEKRRSQSQLSCLPSYSQLTTAVFSQQNVVGQEYLAVSRRRSLPFGAHVTERMLQLKLQRQLARTWQSVSPTITPLIVIY
jgi:hypothetical protein